MSPSFLLDLSDRAKLRLRGADRVRFLQGQVTNDVRRATPGGEGVYVCVLTAKGKLCADAHVSAGPDFLQLDAEPGLRESLAARLERYLIADEVEIEDVTDAVGHLHLLGEHARERNDLDGALIARSNRFGQPGTDIFCPRDELPGIRAALLAAAPAGCRELDPAGAEQLRILAGVPRWGAELDENTLPPEAGLEARAIDYHKGCYVGQEVISRLKSLGRVNRRLCQLRTAGGPPLKAGMVLRAMPGAGHDAAAAGVGVVNDLGRVTSAAPASPEQTGSGGYVALGYVRRGFETPGAVLLAVDPANDDPAQAIEVAAPPSSHPIP